VKIRLLSVGKPREAVLSGLHDRYAARLVRLGVQYATDHVSDVPAGRRYAAEHALEREARSLFERIRPGETVIALDGEGLSLTSQGLADRIERWTTPRGTLVVGGPLGLHPSVLARADHTWSLSPLTFPHELVRVLIVEQLYRAVSIRRGLPYHK